MFAQIRFRLNYPIPYRHRPPAARQCLRRWRPVFQAPDLALRGAVLRAVGRAVGVLGIILILLFIHHRRGNFCQHQTPCHQTIRLFASPQTQHTNLLQCGKLLHITMQLCWLLVIIALPRCSRPVNHGLPGDRASPCNKICPPQPRLGPRASDATTATSRFVAVAALRNSSAGTCWWGGANCHTRRVAN